MIRWRGSVTHCKSEDEATPFDLQWVTNSCRENLEGTVSQRINTKHIKHHAFLKVTPILRTYVLATHRLLYHAQTKNAYTILDCTGAKDSEINQTILKAVEYYRTVQGSLVNVIRGTGQESPALHGFPSLKFGIMHFRLVRSKGIFTWHCYGLQAQSGLSRTSMNTIASHYQAFQRQK